MQKKHSTCWSKNTLVTKCINCCILLVDIHIGHKPNWPQLYRPQPISATPLWQHTILYQPHISIKLFDCKMFTCKNRVCKRQVDGNDSEGCSQVSTVVSLVFTYSTVLAKWTWSSSLAQMSNANSSVTFCDIQSSCPVPYCHFFLLQTAEGLNTFSSISKERWHTNHKSYR